MSVSSLLAADNIPSVAAASSLQFALKDIVDAFHQDTGENLRISYSSSGNLARQIQQGAPYQLFLSANDQYINHLYQQQLTIDKGVTFALGRLALLSNNKMALSLDEQWIIINKALQQQTLNYFAIANPIHAPYGVAAREILQKQGIWKLIQPHLVLGENVAQATQFISSDAAQMGLVSYSLTFAPVLQKTTQSLLIPIEMHHPIKQTAVLLKNAENTAKLFFHYLQQNKAGQILTQYGYSKP